MGGKLSPIIIVVLLVVVIIIAIVIFGVLTGKGGFTDPIEKEKTPVSDEFKPKIHLEKEPIEENATSVKIKVNVTMENDEEIDEIILPDGSTVKGSYTVFEATENQEYTFKATSESGATDSNSIEVTEIIEFSATNPYVPTGFSVVKDDVKKGYVIADEYGNQYVWVPVPTGKLTRKTLLDGKYEETGTSATSLVNSVAKYYGFYIGRFEASSYEMDGEEVAASMEGKVPWTNIEYLDAFNNSNASAEKFGYEDCFTTLMNSYAWDTTLQWLDEEENCPGYSSNTNYGNYSGTVYPTGKTEADEINYICDLAGNVREWTTEIYKQQGSSKNNDNSIRRIVRGGSASLSRTPSSHIDYPENDSETYRGFRMILYK